MSDRELIPNVDKTVYMHDPEVRKPPKGEKLILATRGMICTTGEWTADCIAWHGLLKIPQSVKDRLKASEPLRHNTKELPPCVGLYVCVTNNGANIMLYWTGGYWTRNLDGLQLPASEVVIGWIGPIERKLDSLV